MLFCLLMGADPALKYFFNFYLAHRMMDHIHIVNYSICDVPLV